MDLHYLYFHIHGVFLIISCFILGNPALPVYKGELQSLALGMDVQVFGDNGKQQVTGDKGELVCCQPFPCQPTGFFNDDDGSKYHAAYFDKFPGVWCHGDYIATTEHNGVVIYGRSDAVLNPGGVRIGTAEIYRQVEFSLLHSGGAGVVYGSAWPSSPVIR